MTTERLSYAGRWSDDPYGFVPECQHCDDEGCDWCCEGIEEARDLEDLEERCGDYMEDR